MLIEKKLTNGEVVTIRLMNGEEVIGRLAQATTTNAIKLSKPILVGLRMLPTNEAQIAFMPFLASTDEDSTVTIGDHAIAVQPVRTRSDVANKYVQATSDIVIPDAHTSSLITG